MKVLFINTSDLNGGAAIAAVRLATRLKESKACKCFFVVGDKKSDSASVFCSRTNNAQVVLERKMDNLLNKVGWQYLFVPFSSFNIIKAIKEIVPDVISLHNIHGGFFQTSLLKKISKYAPVVWTLHDMWSFNGNAAHAFDDDAWKYMKRCKYHEFYPSIGINTTEWLLKRKKEIYQGSNFTVVTPSKWLFDLARQAPVFEGKPICQIYNGVDMEIFKPKDKQACRIALGIPPNEKVLMFCSADLKDSTWKGGGRFLQLLADIDAQLTGRVNVLIVGKGDISEMKKFEKLKVWPIGYLDNERLMATCYSAADLFVYVTVADNLPNALIESISCGTPVLTSDVGGCREIIREGVNGYLFAADAMSAFADRVAILLGDKERLVSLGRQARRYAEDNFSISKMCEDYWGLFNKVRLSSDLSKRIPK